MAKAKRGPGRPKGSKAKAESASVSHDERAQRRKDIANHMRKHHDAAAAAKEFGVGIQTVYSACRENKVTIKKDKKVQKVAGSTFEILAELIAGRKGTEIAEQFGCSKQFVYQAKDRAEKAGVFRAVAKAPDEVRAAKRELEEAKAEIEKLTKRIGELGDGQGRRITRETEYGILADAIEAVDGGAWDERYEGLPSKVIEEIAGQHEVSAGAVRAIVAAAAEHGVI